MIHVGQLVLGGQQPAVSIAAAVAEDKIWTVGVVCWKRASGTVVGSRTVQDRTAVVLEVFGGGIAVGLSVVVLDGGTVATVSAKKGNNDSKVHVHHTAMNLSLIHI